LRIAGMKGAVKGLRNGVGGIFVEAHGEARAGDLSGARLNGRLGGRLGFDRSRGLGRRKRPLVKLGQQLVLGGGDGLGAAGGDFCGGLGLLGLPDGAFGLGGQEGAVALGVGVAFGNCGGDAGSAGLCGRGAGRRNGRRGGLRLVVAGAVGGESFGHLLFQCKGRGRRFRLRGGCSGSFIEWLYLKLCRAHCAQT